MTILVLTDCPPKLRGDVTKWLLEINTGVYVGNISARVREQLWERVCENVKHGRATMVFRAANEQHMDFWNHNAAWQPVDYDGIKLLRRPAPRVLDKAESPPLQTGFSNAAKYQKIRSIERSAAKGKEANLFVIDLETTGLDHRKDQIIELAAVQLQDGKAGREFSVLVQIQGKLPDEITKLTGITQADLQTKGQPLEEAMRKFHEFIGDGTLVCHNAGFEQGFLFMAAKQCGMAPLTNVFYDTLRTAKRKISGVPNYKLETLAKYFGLKVEQTHRALADCHITLGIYQRLNEN
jgi:CRISPR-associated protein Cas2